MGIAFLREKGMVGSVYAAFWALKAAYELDIDHGSLALEWMTSCSNHSWCYMMSVGATATMEAWTRAEKPNLSWSHPWASAPVSAVVWGLFGIVPTAPTFSSFSCKPQTGNLTHASIKVPTARGEIVASFVADVASHTFQLNLSPPAGSVAQVCLPSLGLPGVTLTIDGKIVEGYAMRDYVCVDRVGSGGAAGRI